MHTTARPVWQPALEKLTQQLRDLDFLERRHWQEEWGQRGLAEERRATQRAGWHALARAALDPTSPTTADLLSRQVPEGTALATCTQAVVEVAKRREAQRIRMARYKGWCTCGSHMAAVEDPLDREMRCPDCEALRGGG